MLDLKWLGLKPTFKGASEFAHKDLGLVMQVMSAGEALYIPGPSGCGKTEIARSVAAAMSLDFHAVSRVSEEFKLTGYTDAYRRYHRTPFRDAYEKGGLFLFDEIDASDPAALVAINMALANSEYPFPDKTVTKHPNFRCIAAANTWGDGATAQYVGRTALDGASLDRFLFFSMGYDPKLEMALALKTAGLHKEARRLAGRGDIKLPQPVNIGKYVAPWTDVVHETRAIIESQGIEHIVSTRAVTQGLNLMRVGLSPIAAFRMAVMKTLPSETQENLINALDDHSRYFLKNGTVRTNEHGTRSQRARRGPASPGTTPNLAEILPLNL